MSRIIAIPDIHGRNDLLGHLMEALAEGHGAWPKFTAGQDSFVFLGDMIDRGFDSKGVVERVQAIQRAYQGTVVLRGNHEQFALDSMLRCDAEMYQCWMRENNGGAMTMASYQGVIPGEVLEWMQALPTSFETQGFFFSHAPVPRDNRRPVHLREQPFTEAELTWSYDADEFGFSRNFGDGKVGVCGHIHKLRYGIMHPRFYEHYIFADAGSGCSPFAPLVAVDVQTRRYLAVDALRGHIRIRLLDEEHKEINA